ncbi:hypothetical protein ACHAQH_007784 [Verticillium albo-atrum]
MSREIGSLRALSNGESQYVGSSSGVYFINTVKRAFYAAAAAAAGANPRRDDVDGQLTGNPSPEDCIVGSSEEQVPPTTPSAPSQDVNGTSRLDAGPCPPWDTLQVDDLRKLPDYATARQLVMTYFRIWHPLVPFLNGPVCMTELDALYAEDNSGQSVQPPSIGQAVIYRCISNIASLDNPDLSILSPVKMGTPAQLLPALALLALRCDIASIQALLCAQLYFVATMALRNASTVGGLVSKSIFQSGFHRCPQRYAHLLPDDRAMRKRIFWSAYVLDRFLSQSLGHPNGIQDSDIDVCPAGARDLYEPATQPVMSPSSTVGNDPILHLPVNHLERHAASPRLRGADDERSGRVDGDDAADSGSEAADFPPREPAAVSQHRREVQAVLASHVRYSRLIGQILEIFHKSIHVRATDSRAVLYLKADIGA